MQLCTTIKKLTKRIPVHALLLLGVCVVGSSFTHSAYAAPRKVTKASLATVCLTQTSVVGNSGTFIYKNSAPIRSGGVGTPLVGYRKEPTLIMVKNVSTRGTTTIYDSQGTSIGRCPWASAHDTQGGRFRCSMTTASLRKKAVTNTRSAEIYFLLNPRTKSCAKVPDAGRCYGSVKGLCNQLIK
jgi:hypothetical protein